MARAQSTASLSGRVVSAKSEVIPYANVILNSTADPDSVQFELTNEEGNFKFHALKPNRYWIKVSFVGLPDYVSDTFLLVVDSTLQLPLIQLAEASNELTEVKVVGKRPLVVLRPNKIIFNVEGTINATGGNALELLRKSPGVIVDNNDAIRLAGAQGVLIYIDDKPSPLRGRDLASFLRTIQASEIKNIEIIANPSSKYDAEGSAGIINIQLKKDKSLGANANFNLGYSIGELPWYNGGVNFNNRNKKTNIFGSYSYSLGESVTNSQISRQQNDIQIAQTNRSVSGWNTHNLKSGIDLYLNKESTLGFQFKGYFTDYSWEDAGKAPISGVRQYPIDSILYTDYNFQGRRSNLNFNANYRLNYGEGNALNLDVDYGNYQNPAESIQDNTFYSPFEDQVLSRNNFETDNPTGIQIFSFKADLEKKLGQGILNAGLKITNNHTNNRFDFFNFVNDIRSFDFGRSQKFNYSENINAYYSTYQWNVNKLSLQAGLRAEQTNTRGILKAFRATLNNDVKRQYLNLFPSAGLSLELGPKNSLQLNYSRRIKRPSFQNLNPFLNPLDGLTAEQGNPYLKPEYTQKIQLTHAFNYQIYTSLSFSRTIDQIIRVGEISEGSNTVFRLRNLATQKNVSLSTSATHQLTNWWSTYNNLTLYYIQNRDELGGIEQLIDIEGTSLYIYSQQSFSLPADFSLEIYGWYNSPGVSGANTKSKAISSIDAGLRKKLWDNAATISISFSDIFRSSKWYSESYFDGIRLISSGYWDSRRFNLSFSYSLGNQKIKKVKDRSGVKEEDQRAAPDDQEQRRKKG